MESSRVMIEVVEEYGDGLFNVCRHEHGTIGSVDVATDLASALDDCGGRVLLRLAKAAVLIDENRRDSLFVDESAFIREARAVVDAWDKFDESEAEKCRT